LACLQQVVQKNVRTSDWRALQASLEDLRILSEKHSDVSVRKMADKLRLVIATHGAVLKETDALKERTDRVRIATISYLSWQAQCEFKLEILP
jgi:hypothetical protein